MIKLNIIELYRIFILVISVMIAFMSYSFTMMICRQLATLPFCDYVNVHICVYVHICKYVACAYFALNYLLCFGAMHGIPSS